MPKTEHSVGKIRILPCGYDDHTTNGTLGSSYGKEAQKLGELMRQVLKAQQPLFQVNNACTVDNLLREIANIGRISTSGDHLFFYYSGHGGEQNLLLPTQYVSPTNFDLEAFPKSRLFQALEPLQGNKLVILDCCYGDYQPIPDDVLLVSSSRGNTVTWSDSLFQKIMSDLRGLYGSQNPCDRFVDRLLTQYHNFPFAPLAGTTLMFRAYG